MTVVKELDHDVHAIAYSMEGKLAKQLAGNEKPVRDNAFKRVKKYIVKQSKQADGGFEKKDMDRLWKGLFYCMWMSDKPLVHEELARKMSGVITSLHNSKTSCLYFESFIATIEREWHGIDKWRMDKFLLLIRFMFEKILAFLKQNSWNEELVTWLITNLKNGPLSSLTPSPAVNRGSPIGVRLHFLDIYLAELTRCGHDSLTSEQVSSFLQPIFEIACWSNVVSLKKYSVQHVLQEVINQSDVVLDVVSEKIDVEIEKLNYDYASIASNLLQTLNHSNTVEANRESVSQVLKKLKDVSEGHLPLGDVPDFLNEQLDMKKFENDLAEKWMVEAEEEEKKRKAAKTKKSNQFFEKKRSDRKRKFKGEHSSLPYQNADFKDIDFDAIAAKYGDVEQSEEPVKKKTKQKAKPKKKSTKNGNKLDLNAFISINDSSLNSKEKTASSTDQRNVESKSKLKHMMEDLVEAPSDAVATKTRLSTRRRKRLELTRALREKLFDDVPESDRSAESFSASVSLSNDQVEKPLVQFASTPPKSTFLKNAVKKVEAKSKKRKVALNKVEETVKTPKKVVFELSKTQVQPFKKNDRSCVLSPSPALVPFDPKRTPDYGLLKPQRTTPKRSATKRKRPRASDFF